MPPIIQKLQGSGGAALKTVSRDFVNNAGDRTLEGFIERFNTGGWGFTGVGNRLKAEDLAGSSLIYAGIYSGEPLRITAAMRYTGVVSPNENIGIIFRARGTTDKYYNCRLRDDDVDLIYRNPDEASEFNTLDADVNIGAAPDTDYDFTVTIDADGNISFTLEETGGGVGPVTVTGTDTNFTEGFVGFRAFNCGISIANFTIEETA